jgi:hypothetical protein
MCCFRKPVVDDDDDEVDTAAADTRDRLVGEPLLLLVHRPVDNRSAALLRVVVVVTSCGAKP